MRGNEESEEIVTIPMSDLQRALEVLRQLETYFPDSAPAGQLGRLRAEAYCARIAIETVIGKEEVEIS